MTYANPTPSTLKILAAAALAGGGLSLLWIVFGNQGVLPAALGAAVGDGEGAAHLHALTGGDAGRVFVRVPATLLRLALAGILTAAAVGLLQRRPGAAPALLLYCGASVIVEGICTLLEVTYLTPPGRPIQLLPILVSGLTVQLAVFLWGGLYLPEAAVAWAPSPGRPSG